MRYILGIDQGSSKTQVIIGDDKGTILGMGKSYGACHSVTGLQYAMDAISLATNQAFKKNNFSWNEIDIIVAGLTGVDWKYEVDLLMKELYKMSGVDNIIIKNDCIIAMRAGTTNPYRSVICAGSGLNCAVHKSDREEFVYGFYIDDEFQGGYGLGKACLKAVMDAEIGLESETVLKEMLLKHFNVKSVDDLLFMRTMEKIHHDQYLYLPIILEQAAIMNDKVALSVWEKFGKQFASYLVSGLRKMDLLDEESDIVISGSIFKCKCQILKQTVESQIKLYAPKARIIDAEYEPVIGAYLLGLDFIGGNVFNDQDKQLKKSVEKYGLYR